MNNYKSGGQRNRSEYIGGRPKSDANYGPKKFSIGSRQENRNPDRGFKRDHGSSSNNVNRQTELFKTTCTRCGKSTEVPFRPDGIKPVLCRECFANKQDGKGDNSSNERISRPEKTSLHTFSPHSVDRRATPSQPDYTALLNRMSALEMSITKLTQTMLTQQTTASTSHIPTEVAKPVKKEIDKDKPAKKLVKKVAAKKVAKSASKKVVKK